MIKAKHKKFFSWFIKWYTKYMLKKHFHRIHIHSHLIEKNSSMLVIGNHFSWWDGFFVFYINDLLYKKKFHVMMLEEQLKNNFFLHKVGAFSVNKGKRSILKSLKYATEIIERPNNLLLLFPQGEIQSSYQTQFTFEKGLEKIIKNAKADFQMLFMAALIDYFSEKKPSLNLYCKEFPCNTNTNIKSIEKEYNLFFQNCIKKQDHYK